MMEFKYILLPKISYDPPHNKVLKVFFCDHNDRRALSLVLIICFK